MCTALTGTDNVQRPCRCRMPQSRQDHQRPASPRLTVAERAWTCRLCRVPEATQVSCLSNFLNAQNSDCADTCGQEEEHAHNRQRFCRFVRLYTHYVSFFSCASKRLALRCHNNQKSMPASWPRDSPYPTLDLVSLQPYLAWGVSASWPVASPEGTDLR
jgi:hypothetical protein